MLALVVTVPLDEVEVASDELWALGVVAIEERSVDEHTIELWTSLGDEVQPADMVAGGWSSRWPMRMESVDESVADTWREFARPIEVDHDLFIRPRWIPFEAPVGATVLHIEPGSTFGMGDHPTTMLSLRAVRRVVTPGCTVLDVGCGSGVLAIGACRFGASSAVGIDISPAAVPVTIDNAAANGVATSVSVSTDPLAEVAADHPGMFDVVAANILAPTLVALADDLRRVVKPGGALVISGILAEAHQHVLDALAPLTVVCTDSLDGWVAVTLAAPR